MRWIRRAISPRLAMKMGSGAAPGLGLPCQLTVHCTLCAGSLTVRWWHGWLPLARAGVGVCQGRGRKAACSERLPAVSRCSRVLRSSHAPMTRRGSTCMRAG